MKHGSWIMSSASTCMAAIALCMSIAGVRGHADGASLDQREGRLAMVDILGDAYPRAFFFRQAEGTAARLSVSYEDWEETFGRLMGIEGKVLDEEVVGRSVRNIDFFTRFKERHPNQLVLLHFNGNARDPRWESDRFFAGHWVYHNGARITSDIPAREGVMDIAVEDTRLFKVNMGRYRDKNEDIGLCVLDAKGRPDWSQSEQVQLVSVDRENGTIRVRRGCYGTVPRAFSGGRSYAAAHATEGPWGKNNHLMWFYNYSTHCPRDALGRTCSDVLVDHLAELYAPDGPLATFDGLEFDVLHFRCGGGGSGRGPDCDADGRADGGNHGGVNTYGVGVTEFCRQLRDRLGEDRLILADGMGERNQRAFGLLNGIESEGWPHLSDHVIQGWSGGLNRHFFWAQNARTPAFNYINHKFRVPSGEPGQPLRAEVPFSTDRLVFAVAAFTDSAVCYSDAPANDPDGRLGIWDELRMGTENHLGWLGRPLGPTRRAAAGQQELLGLGTPRIGASLMTRFRARQAQFSLREGVLKVEARGENEANLWFRLTDIPTDGPDLLVLVSARGAPMQGYPSEVARMMRAGIPGSGGGSLSGVRYMTWVNGEDFESSFYFPSITSRSVDLEFTVEGPEPIWISRIEVYPHPEAMYREFENGLVLANPSPRPYTFDLACLLPGQRFRRLKGSVGQDPLVNDGSPVPGTVTLGSKDALFLVKGK